MDLSKNRIPDAIKSIHMIAICGTGMGALASLLKDMGFDITGSDQKVYPPMSEFLLSKGIEITEGFSENNVAYGPELVIVGNAVSKDNPDVLGMQQMGLEFCSMPQAVNRFVASGKKTLVVTGTHGKTTTSAILAWILYESGLDPTFMIGGILNNFESNYRLGRGEHMIIEGDEYDTAFFDKGPKFLHYDPSIAILTGVEFDHADIFKDIQHVKQAFNDFITGMSRQHTLVAFDNDKNVADLIHGKSCRVVKYGKNANAQWHLGAVTIEPPWTYFEVFKQDNVFGKFRTRLVGEHNLLNSLAVIAVADKLAVPVEAVARAFESFEGVKRRQEIRGEKSGVTVMDDFAHHPTAVRETIRAVKPFYPNGRLIAVFEPRTNSSMRNIFQNVYPLSFDGADLICIRQPPLLDKIPPKERFSSQQLVKDLNRQGKDAHYFADTDEIIDFLVTEATPGDLILVMSNGGFDNIHERLLFYL
ncbi:MAG: UDP-N-acetylmuramate:L-alanyl-gamma-D-glutamyl-meso-diaminopimelate ligase [Deltaproteobacteria bacterium]|jgi:UDP-N-acetylmuramate: L-alanyl-gamma-D-glutamyl-meso-diaminopimelate ligase|nr:UDP-N-acetylmuramate:L-alanyl-gamma-D-glutamyl-meso-diaminopimelate ligase [Deltaproteobacteria bacterium]